MTVLRSKHAHEKGVSRTPHMRRRKKRGVAPVTKMQSKRVHDKGGCSEVESRIPRRSLGKVDNVLGKRETERGNKEKSGAEEGIMVEKEGKGIGDVIVRHRIGQREVPFSVYDVALLTGLLATGKHVTFNQGKGPYEVEDVVKAAMDDHISRKRVWFYEHTNLYAHADEKCVPRIIIPYLELRDLGGREATVKAFSDIEDFNTYVEDAQYGVVCHPVCHGSGGPG
ncbi:hypothetical protein Cgig2_024769 [Carnegiea gigantea]|uniref:Uncharacterized protein n=1 Tax=Carnegiea gigantea TaxID=171969 RepID=A0A9Q1GGV8_9CARY|nr:hypothetical protein Cgig2_024769 [Carnegiea gigantea]